MRKNGQHTNKKLLYDSNRKQEHMVIAVCSCFDVHFWTTHRCYRLYNPVSTSRIKVWINGTAVAARASHNVCARS